MYIMYHQKYIALRQRNAMQYDEVGVKVLNDDVLPAVQRLAGSFHWQFSVDYSLHIWLYLILLPLSCYDLHQRF